VCFYSIDLDYKNLSLSREFFENQKVHFGWEEFTELNLIEESKKGRN